MIFISHSTKDKAVAIALKDKLLARGYTDAQVFLDSDADSGIRAGDEWEKKLYSHLRRCVALIAICSENFDRSGWCFAEVVRTKDRNKPIFPVFIQDCSIRAPLGDHQAVFPHKEGEAAAYARLFTALEEKRLGPTDFFVWEGDCPYPGLFAFDEKLAGVYFGREGEIDSLRTQLADMHRRGEPRFLMITGGSGSGKSSLLKAGLLPRLGHQAARRDWIVLPVLRFGQSANSQFSIFDQLAKNVATAFPEGSPRYGDWQAVRAQLGPEQDGSAFIATLVDLAIARDTPDATVLLPIDQFEELLAPSAGPVASDFIRFLATLCTGRNERLLGIGTMRSDYLEAYGNHPHALKGKLLLPFILGPFPQAAIGDVILKPAECAGVEITDDLLARLKEDAPGGQSLPLLAFTLEKLYRTYAADKKLELHEYLELGGMQGSIQKCVERVREKIPFTPQRTAALRRSFVQHLVQINDKDKPVRETARWSDLEDDAKPILQAFIDERLLISSRHEDPQDPKKNRTTVEVAHEALFTAWKELDDWITKSIDVIRWRQSIRRDRRENPKWSRLTHAQLSTARRWPETRMDELDEEEVGWIKKGRQRQWWIRWGIAAAFVLIAFSAVWAWHQTGKAETEKGNAVESAKTADKEKGKAEEARKEAEGAQKRAEEARKEAESAQGQAERSSRRNLAQRLAVQSESLSKRSPRHAAILASKALQVGLDSEENHAVAIAAANRVLRASMGARCHETLDGAVDNAVFDRGEDLLAVDNGTYGKIQILDLSRPPAQSLMHEFRADDHFKLVAFDGTGLNLIALGRDPESEKMSVRIWELKKGTKHPVNATLLSADETFEFVAASNDQRWLAASHQDGIWLYDLNDISKRRVERRLNYRNNDALALLGFTRDGRLLWTVSRSGWLQLWNLESAESVPCACFRSPNLDEGEESSTKSCIVAISDDRSALFTAGKGGANLWHLKGFQPKGRPDILAHQQQVILAEFLPGQDHALATADGSGRVYRWSTEFGAPEHPEVLFESPNFKELQISPDRRSLAVYRSDGVLAIHSLVNPSIESLKVRMEIESGNGVRFSPRGKWLAMFGFGGTYIWRYSQGERLLDPSMVGRPGVKYDGALVVGSGSLAALFSGEQVELWGRRDQQAGRLLSTAAAPSSIFFGGLEDRLKISPDGKWIAAEVEDREGLLVRPTEPGRPGSRLIPTTTSEITTSGFSQDSRWFATGGGSEVLLYELGNPEQEPLRLADSREGASVHSLKFSDGGQWIFARVEIPQDGESYLGGGCLWQLDRAGRPLRSFEIGSPGVSSGSVVFSADQSWLAFADATNEGVSVIHLGEAALHLQSLGPASQFVLSPDSRWLICMGEQPRLWELDRMGTVRPVDGASLGKTIEKAVFSNDGRYLAATASLGSSTEILEYDDARSGFVTKGKLRGRSAGAGSWSVVFSPDSKRVAASSPEDLNPYLWSLTERGPLPLAIPLINGGLDFTGGNVEKMAFTSDSASLFTLVQSISRSELGEDSTTRIDAFDVSSIEREIMGATIFDSPGHEAKDFHLDEQSGTILILGNTLHEWPVMDSKVLTSQLGAFAARNPTWEEWFGFDLPGSYRKVFSTLPVHPTVPHALAALLSDGHETAEGLSAAQVLELAIEVDHPDATWHVANALAKRGDGDLALRAIEAALKHDPKDLTYRDTRGVARALTGDLKGAAADFEYYVDQFPRGSESSEVPQRRDWLSELRAGRNPFANGYPKE